MTTSERAAAPSGGRAAGAGDLLDDYGLYVDGRWVAPERGRFDDCCPTTGEVVARVPDADVGQVAAAIGVARSTADGGVWSGADPAFRAACLTQLSDALRRHRGELVALSRVEWGNTASGDLLQIDAGTHLAAGTAPLAALPTEETEAGPAGPVVVRHAPVGVVSVITPWNFPHTINLLKVAPALAAGNTVVLKPSPLAPMAALALAHLVDTETDIPAGVLNVVPTSSQEASEALVLDPRVDMVSFTGSTATGRVIMAMAGRTLKRLLLELGGKSACILLDGVDLDALLGRLAFECCTMHAGQACILQSRLLVPVRLHDEVAERLGALVAATRVGDPVEGAEMGPLISAAQRSRVEALVATALTEGARVVTGGRRPGGLDHGHFYEPTVLTGVAPSSTIAQSEVFGPVLSILAYRDEDEAVAIANDSAYGLSGAVHGPDPERATAVARRLRTGQVAVNGATPAGAPFGGFKQSGLGREGGLSGLRQYTETQAIGVPR
jgi:acyl-CoA reductase-like NAD-dependent aldehyde dehydrogenase